MGWWISGAWWEEQALGSGDLNSCPPLTQQARWFGQEQPLWASVSHSPKCIPFCIISQEPLSSEILGSYHLLYNCQVLFISVSISSLKKQKQCKGQICACSLHILQSPEKIYSMEKKYNSVISNSLYDFYQKRYFFQNSFFFSLWALEATHLHVHLA